LLKGVFDFGKNEYFFIGVFRILSMIFIGIFKIGMKGFKENEIVIIGDSFGNLFMVILIRDFREIFI
jgi:hypothetical protein